MGGAASGLKARAMAESLFCVVAHLFLCHMGDRARAAESSLAIRVELVAGFSEITYFWSLTLD